MSLLETSERSNDRRLTMLMILSLFVALSMILATVIGGPKILSSASTTKEIKRGNEVAGCRAGYRSGVDDAGSTLQRKRVLLDVATSEALSAVAARNAEAFVAATKKGEAARDEILKAAAALEAATDLYAERIQASRSDPKKFLVTCHREQP